MMHNETDPKDRVKALATNMLLRVLKDDLALSRDEKWTSRMRAEAGQRVDLYIDELMRRFRRTQSIPEHVIEALKTAAPYGRVTMDVDGPAEFVSGWRGEDDDERTASLDAKRAKADDLSQWVDVLQGRLSAQTERGDELAKRVDALEATLSAQRAHIEALVRWRNEHESKLASLTTRVNIADGLIKAHEPVLSEAARKATEAERRDAIYTAWTDATAARITRLENVLGIVRNA